MPTISPSSAATPGRTERSGWSSEVSAAAAAARRHRTALAGGALAQQREEPLLRHRLAEQEALAEVAAHAGQRERIGGLLDADRRPRALPKLCARSITVLQSGALTLSVPQSLTKVRSSLSSANGSSLSRASDE